MSKTVPAAPGMRWVSQWWWRPSSGCMHHEILVVYWVLTLNCPLNLFVCWSIHNFSGEKIIRKCVAKTCRFLLFKGNAHFLLILFLRKFLWILSSFTTHVKSFSRIYFLCSRIKISSLPSPVQTSICHTDDTSLNILENNGAFLLLSHTLFATSSYVFSFTGFSHIMVSQTYNFYIGRFGLYASSF
jgi:hypothetical protein